MVVRSRRLAEDEVVLSTSGVRLRQSIPQPISVYGHLATVWDLVPATGSPPTGADLGRLLKQWHALPAPSTGLPSWAPLVSIRRRLDGATVLREGEVTFLENQCDALDEELSGLTFLLPQGPIWGDAFLGNVIPGPYGAVACDFDGSSFGPREWDLTPIAVGAIRFQYPGGDQSLLADEYGFDITAWDGFPVLRRTRELQLVTSVLPVLDANPSLRAQWRHRFDSYRRGDGEARWSPYR